jgi:hypothetical protein
LIRKKRFKRPITTVELISSVPRAVGRSLKINRKNIWRYRKRRNVRVSGKDILIGSTGQPAASRRAVVTDAGFYFDEQRNDLAAPYAEREKGIWKKSNTSCDPLCPVTGQIAAWRKANRKMRWQIPAKEFQTISAPPRLTDTDIRDGFAGVILSYGFGDDGQGNADAVLSGKLAWDFAVKGRQLKTWQCEYVDFSQPDHFRLRPEAPPRPKGFYFAKFRFGEYFPSTTVSQFRRQLPHDTGCGPEGIQFLAITHRHCADLMNARKLLFMAFADYDVAPYGFNDFFDALQMFCSVDTLGLGIGNVDQNYPLFGIPTLRF